MSVKNASTSNNEYRSKMAYQHSTYTLTTSSEPVSLFWQKWMPESTVDRVLVFQHGMGEHAGRYQHLLDALANTGTALYALDARGHGRTEGRRGYVARFGLFADDLGELIQLARSENEQQKVLLLGHSLGGSIVLDYALRAGNQENLRGLILSSPAIEVPISTKNRLLKATAGILSKLAPGAVLDTMLSQAALSHDADTIAAYRADPLVHGKASILMGHTLFHVSQRFYDEAS